MRLIDCHATGVDHGSNITQMIILRLMHIAHGGIVANGANGDGRDNHRDRQGQRQAELQGIDQKSRERLQLCLETIHPNPRTFLIDCAPSFLRKPWIKNSIALLSTSWSH